MNIKKQNYKQDELELIIKEFSDFVANTEIVKS